MRSSTVFLAGIAALTATLALSRPASANMDKDEWGNEKEDDDEKKAVPKAAPKTVEPPPAEGDWNIYDVEEKPGKAYYFVGLSYRGIVIPKFEINLFVQGAKTVYTNQLNVEFEYRKDGFSMIPGLSYHELGTGDILFRQKNTPDIPGNYSLVNSGLKVVYAKMDLLWSYKFHKNIEFEYGLGFGLGAVFGDLENSWVQQAPNGELANDNGVRYTRCNAVGPKGTGCNEADHQGTHTDKVNGYQEKSWFNGGYKPAIIPWLSIPQVGLRFKPIKNVVARLSIGWSLTGFWFGLGGQYGLEQKPKP